MTDSPRAGTGRLLAGRYRLDRHLASGGMAEVWEATDEVLDRPVAVKLLHGHLADDPALRARFHHEAVAAARLVHPAIVAIYDTCDDPGAEAIVMELVRGRTLREFLDERGRLDPVEVVHIGAEVASALTCAHKAGIIHRDVKPANILLSDDGRVLVTDFGIAKVLDEPDLTRTSQLLGTVKYLAPEQVESGPVDARTDVYALGAVLYESLCGEAPFRADNQAAARAGPAPPRPSTSPRHRGRRASDARGRGDAGPRPATRRPLRHGRRARAPRCSACAPSSGATTPSSPGPRPWPRPAPPTPPPTGWGLDPAHRATPPAGAPRAVTRPPRPPLGAASAPAWW